MQIRKAKINVFKPRARHPAFKEMVKILSDKTGYPSYFITDFYDYFVAWFHLQVATGGEVHLPAIGKFRRLKRKPRLFHSPLLDTFHISYTSDSVTFKPAKALRLTMKEGRTSAADRQEYLKWLHELLDNGKISQEIYDHALLEFNKPLEEKEADNQTETERFFSQRLHVEDDDNDDEDS